MHMSAASGTINSAARLKCLRERQRAIGDLADRIEQSQTAGVDARPVARTRAGHGEHPRNGDRRQANHVIDTCVGPPQRARRREAQRKRGDQRRPSGTPEPGADQGGHEERSGDDGGGAQDQVDREQEREYEQA